MTMMAMPLKMIMRIWEPCRRSVWPEDIFNLIVDHVNNFLHLLKQIKFDHFAVLSSNVPNIFTFNVLVKLWLWYSAALKLDVQSVILPYSDNFVESSFYNIYKKIATSLLKSVFWRFQNNLSAKYLRQLASTRNWRKF